MTTDNTTDDGDTLFTDKAEQLLLSGILDVLIPASKDGIKPAAGALGICDFLAKKAAIDPAIQVLLREAISETQSLVEESGMLFADMSIEARIILVRKLESTAPECFAGLLRQTYMGYYSRPDIRAALDLSPQATQPDGYAVPVEPPDEMAKLTRPVTERGRCYRAC